MYLDYEEQFNLLSDEQIGQLMRAIIQYERTQEMPKLDGVLKMAFSFIKTQLDRDREKYKAKCEKNKENGARGGRPRKQKDISEPNGFEETKGNFQKPKKADNEDDNENEDVNDSEEDNDLLSNNDVEEVQKIIIETLGSTNLTVIQEAISYLDDFPLEVIKEALVRTARKQKRWDYARGTLNNWLKDGLNTIDKIKANDLQFETKKEIKEETEEEKLARKIKELGG